MRGGRPSVAETLCLGRSPGKGKGYPLQYSGLENSMDFTVHGVAKGWLDLTERLHFHFSFSSIGASSLVQLIFLKIYSPFPM